MVTNHPALASLAHPSFERRGIWPDCDIPLLSKEG